MIAVMKNDLVELYSEGVIKSVSCSHQTTSSIVPNPQQLSFFVSVQNSASTKPLTHTRAADASLFCKNRISRQIPTTLSLPCVVFRWEERTTSSVGQSWAQTCGHRAKFAGDMQATRH